MVVMATKHPNPDLVGETWMLNEARRLSAELGLTGRHVFFNEGWVPYENRADWYLEADVGVSTNFEHIESHFSFRVRFLDYLWCGLPILCSSGDILAEAVERDKLGLTVAPGDVDGLAAAIETLADPSVRQEYGARVGALAGKYTWSQAAAPLVRFCDQPRRAPDLVQIAPMRALPVPLQTYSLPGANGDNAPAPWETVVRKDWRYYAVKAADTLVYKGPLVAARKGGSFVARRLARGRPGAT
jgi:hypothetical protein